MWGSTTKIGPDRLNRFDVYWIQTQQTSKVYIYRYLVYLFNLYNKDFRRKKTIFKKYKKVSPFGSVSYSYFFKKLFFLIEFFVVDFLFYGQRRARYLVKINPSPDFIKAFFITRSYDCKKKRKHGCRNYFLI